jgi:hypothetical protein
METPGGVLICGDVKWGRCFNERVVLTVPIIGTRKTAEFAACQSDVAALRNLLGAERIVA